MSASRLCPNCRALIDARADHCPYCGISIGAPAFQRRAAGGSLERLMPGGKIVTSLLLLVNIALFIMAQLSNTRLWEEFGTKWLPAILQGDWYRLFTAGYLHTWMPHLLMNMLSLYNLGPIVEEIFGARRMFAAYTIASVSGFIGSCMWSPGSFSLGASAGIFGLLGALIAYGTLSRSFVARNLQQQCLLNAGLGFLMGAFMGVIDNAAHLGGLIGGFVTAYVAGLPRWIDDTREKLWGLVSLVSLLLTLYAFYQFVVRMNMIQRL